MATYRVRKGDTLSKIAEKYGTTVVNLAAINQIVNVNKISVGQILRLPSGSSGKDYSSIGKQLEVCLNDIEKLDSVQKLVSML